MAIHSLASVVLSTTATPLSATSVRANWVQVQGSALTGAARVGDSTVSSTKGAILSSTGDSQFFPALGNANAYDLSAIYVLGTASDTLAVTYNTN